MIKPSEFIHPEDASALNRFCVSAEGECPEGMNNAGKCYFEGMGSY